MHPRTAKNLREAGKTPHRWHYVDPLGYLEFNYLVKHARGVITDSGGITEETTVLGVPCLTLRDNTERPETVTIGTNELIGTDPASCSGIDPLDGRTVEIRRNSAALGRKSSRANRRASVCLLGRLKRIT